MKSFFLGLAAAASLLTAAVPAAAAGPLETTRFSFTEPQSGYDVRARRNAAGTMYLHGEHPQTGETFKLRVSSAGRVTGEFAGRDVDYMLGEGQAATLLAAAE